MKLCDCGCGETAPIAKKTCTRNGHVKGEPVRFVHGHYNRKSAALYEVDERTGCWNWLRATSAGYGRLRIGGRNLVAHRWIYEQHRGPIPDGLQLDHICRNPSCVNPQHLRIATTAENMQNRDPRGYKGGTSGYRGVSWDKGMKKWLAHVTLGGKINRLGYYVDAEEAAKVAAAFRARHMPFSVETEVAA